MLRAVILAVFLGAGLPGALSAQSAADVGGTKLGSVLGKVVPARSWDVTPSISNRIKTLHFIEGQMVAQGDLLVEMESAIKKLELNLARANRDRAAIHVKAAKDDLERKTELREREAVPEAVYMDAKFAVAEAEAELNALNVQLEIARAIVEAQTIRAPFEGQMSALRYRENSNVDIADGTEIATLVQLDPILVHAPLNVDKALERLQSGSTQQEIAESVRIVVELPGGQVYPHIGRVVSASYWIDPDTNTAKVIVEFPNPKHILRPGMTVQVTGYE